MTTWQFVDSIAASPSVLLDINAAPYYVDIQGVDISPPDYDQTWSDNSLAHGSRLAWEKAPNRTLKIPLHIMTSSVAAQETAILNLGLRLAQNGILKIQYGSTPIFVRTFGNPKYAMKIRRALKDSSSIDLEIVAEPFGYGTRVEVGGSPFTLSTNPAVGTNPTRFDISGVLGDVPTPLLMVVTTTGATDGMAGRWGHIATRRRGTPSNLNCVIQAENMTLGNGAVVTADGVYSAGNKVRVTPGLTAMTLRLSDTFPENGTPTVDNRGEYLVYARVGKSVAGDTWDVQLQYGTSSTAIMAANDVQRLPAGLAGPYFVNLGKVPCPIGPDPRTHGFSGVDTKSLVAFVGLYAQRVAGTGALDVDYLYFVPADDQTLIIAFPTTDVQYAIDGTTDSGGAVYGFPYPAMDEILTVNPPARVVGGGGFPEVSPGVTNRIYWLRNIDPAGAVDSISNTSVVRAFYWPRFRELIRP